MFYIYIGETQCIKTRSSKHNSGNGSALITPLHLTPYAVVAFIYGFEGNRILRRYIERQWQQSMIAQLRSSINDTKQIHVADVIVDQNDLLEDVIEPIQLKLQLIFTE